VLAGTGEARRTAIPARAAPDRGHCADPVHPDTPNPPASPDPPPKAASESDIRDIRDKLPLYAAEGGQAEVGQAEGGQAEGGQAEGGQAEGGPVVVAASGGQGRS